MTLAVVPRARRHRGDAVCERGRVCAARRPRRATGDPSGLPAPGRARRGQAGHATAGRAERPGRVRPRSRGDRPGPGHVRAAADPDVRPRAGHPRADRRDRARGAARGVATATRVDRRGAGRPATGAHPHPCYGRLGRGRDRIRASCCVARAWSRRRRGCGRRTSCLPTTCGGTSRPSTAERAVERRSRRGATSSRGGDRAAIDAPAACARRGVRDRRARRGVADALATGQGRRAEREAAISAARELAAASIANLDDDPELAVLLAVEAVERSRAVSGVAVPEAEEALHRAIVASRIVATIPSVRGPVATSVGGRIAAQAVEEAGRVTTWMRRERLCARSPRMTARSRIWRSRPTR